MRYSDTTKRKTVALYPKLSLAQIHQKTGVSEKTLMRWLKEAQVKMRNPIAPRYPKAQILTCIRKGKKPAWICEKFGCSRKYVSQLAKTLKDAA